MAKCALCIALLFGLLARPVVGQPASASLPGTRPSTQYVHRAWTAENGLPQNSVYALEQTRDGYLWIGTLQGLARFDGQRFTVYEASTTPGLESDRISALYEDHDGTLWIGTVGGVSRYQNGQFTAVITADDLPNPQVSGPDALFQDRSGALWVGTFSGLCRLKDGALTVYTKADGLPGNFIHTIFEDRNGDLWVSTMVGLARWDDGVWRPVPDIEGLAGYGFTSIHESQDGTLWLGVSAGFIIHYLDGQFTTYALGIEGEGWVHKIMEDHTGTLWVSVLGKGLFRFDGTRFSPFLFPEDPIGSSVIDIIEDREQLLWIGTNGSGLHRLKEGIFTTYTVEQGLPGRMAHAVYEDRTGAFWVGTYDRGVARFAEGNVTSYTVRDGLPGAAVYGFAEDGAGRLWVGTASGLAVFNGTRFVSLPATAQVSVSALAPGAEGGLLAGTHNYGVVRYRDGQYTHVLTYGQLGRSRVFALYEEPSGVLWAGTMNSGLARLENGALTMYTTEDGLPVNHLRAIKKNDDGALWIGTYGGGLCELRDERFTCLGPQHGLPDGTVHSILEDDRGFVWLSSNKGIFRLARTDIDAFFTGKIDRVRPDVFGTADGMGSSEANGGFQPAAWKARDGRLWFPTTDGVVAVDPAAVAGPVSLSLPVLVEKLVIDGTDLLLQAGLTVAAGSRRLELQYTGIHLSAPEKLRFRYLLEGYDDDWVEAGAQRAAHYTNLQPGRYTFRVQAAIGSGDWSSQEGTLSFRFAPFFWQTWWFLSLCIVLGLGLAIGTYRWRVRSLKQREVALRALVDERTRRLAEEKRKTEEQAHRLAELGEMKSRFFANISHELRTPLTLTLGPLGDVLEASPLAPDARQSLTTAQRNARRLQHLIEQLLDFSKLEAGKLTLHRQQADLIPFLEDLVLALAPLADRNTVTLHFQPERSSMPTHFDRDKLEKAIGNLIVNALKFTPEHGKVVVSARVKDEAAEVEVADTGPGIPPDELPYIFDRFYQAHDSSAQPHAGTGIGLALAKELVELHGGDITVESRLGLGSTFTVRLPLISFSGEKEIIDTPDTAEKMAERGVLTTEEEAGLSETARPSEVDHIRILGAPKILLVEDNAEVRTYLRRHLADHYRLVEAENGAVGLDKARTERPDLILCDVMMPEMDGYALCRTLKQDEHTRAIPLILLTARAAESDRVEGLGLGADDYIVKPFSMKALQARIENLLGSRRKLQAQYSRQVLVQPAGVAVDSEDAVFLERAMAVVEEHLADGHFTVEAFADAMDLSPRQLRRRMRQLTEETPKAFIRRFRLERARQLLAAQAGSVAEVAYQVGFNDPYYFSRCFRDAFGVPPSDYQDPSS